MRAVKASDIVVKKEFTYMATEDDTTASGWNTETLKQFFSNLINNMKDNYDDALREQNLRHQQRFEAAEKAVDTVQLLVVSVARETDLRYQQRFDASEKAVQAAQVAAEKAVQAALAAAKEAVQAASIAAEKSVQAALAAAEKAIEKAEMAQRAHNQMQSNWQSSVNDLVKNVAERARAECESMTTALSDRTTISIKGLEDKIDSAVTRLDKTEGRNVGTAASSTQSLAVVTIIISLAVAGLIAFSTFHTSPPVAAPQIVVSPPASITSPTR